MAKKAPEQEEAADHGEAARGELAGARSDAPAFPLEETAGVQKELDEAKTKAIEAQLSKRNAVIRRRPDCDRARFMLSRKPEERMRGERSHLRDQLAKMESHFAGAPESMEKDEIDLLNALRLDAGLGG